MANTGVKGRVVFAGTGEVPEKGLLTITAVDFDPFFSEDDVLASGTTDDDGNFQLSYPEDKYSLWFGDRRPDIVVRVYTSACRLLFETPEREDVEEEILDVGTITIHKNHTEGWLVTHPSLKPLNGDPVQLSQGNRIAHLIDGSSLFPLITEAVKDASSVNLMTLSIEVGKKLITRFTEDFDPTDPDAKPCKEFIAGKIDDELKKLAQGGAHVNVMVNNIPLSVDDFVDEVREFFKDTGANVRDFNKGFSLLHAKAMIVDGARAFLMGSPVSNRYFSDERHLINDARHRGSLIHDVNMEVTGPAVDHIDRTFGTVWKATKDPSLISTQPLEGNQPQSGDDIASAQVLRTLPGEAFRPVFDGDENLPHGETGILEAYQRAFSLAERYIYIENQYFTSPEIADALIDRMKQEDKSKLEIILVLNLRPDLPGYPDKQIEIVNQLKLAAGKHGHKLGVYTLWSRLEKEKDGKTEFEIMPIYVHSKVAIIDDKWATIGSANLDGTSMNYHQIGLIAGSVLLDGLISKIKLHDDFGKFIKDLLLGTVFYLLKRFLFDVKTLLIFFVVLYKLIKILHELAQIPDILESVFVRTSQHANPNQEKQPPRSVELNLVLYSEIAGQPKSTVIRDLRNRLWEEHLGMESLLADMQEVPEDPQNMGWVDFWDHSAKNHLDAIKDERAQPENHAPKVLAWQPEKDAEDYLEALKVRTKNLRDRAIDYDFEKCKPVTKNKLLAWLIP